nr:hypothetical protein [Tanacetum cinerariifolium]
MHKKLVDYHKLRKTLYAKAASIQASGAAVAIVLAVVVIRVANAGPDRKPVADAVTDGRRNAEVKVAQAIVRAVAQANS